MPRLSLKSLLQSSLDGARKVAVLGVGSELRGDDQAGLLVVDKLNDKCKKEGSFPQLELFKGFTAPENVTGEIKKYAPSHLIVVDAADVGSEPGTIEVIDPDLVGGVSFSTHMMPMKIVMDYVNESMQCKMMIIGIQPKCLEFLAPVSREVRTSVRQVVAGIEAIVRQIPQQDAGA